MPRRYQPAQLPLQWPPVCVGRGGHRFYNRGDRTVSIKARAIQEVNRRMKSKIIKVLLGVVILFSLYLLNRGILVGSTAENVGYVSGTTQPIYRTTCRYLSLNGIKQRIGPPQLSEDFRCSLFK